MRHRVPTPARQLGIGKPRGAFRKNLGKRDSTPSLKSTHNKTENYKKNSKTHISHDLLCGVCLISFQNSLEKLKPQIVSNNITSSSNCSLLFKAAFDIIKNCPYSNRRNIDQETQTSSEEKENQINDYTLPVLDNDSLSKILNPSEFPLTQT